MAEAVWRRVGDQDAIVMAAAVANFRPVAVHDSKLARSDGLPVIELERTPDILAGVVERNDHAIVVGFAAETGSLERAIEKARSKGVDLLVANDVLADGSGFGTVTNQVSVVWPDGTVEPWPLLTKTEVAELLWDVVVELRREGR
jgi:phosphopantothenoylcysteine decarboxylase/phosphopantothenate--cysteine ligase